MMMKKTEIIKNVAKYMFDILSNDFCIYDDGEFEMCYFDDIENLKMFLNKINEILKPINENEIKCFNILNFGCDDEYTLFIHGYNAKLIKIITWDIEYNFYDLFDVDCEYTLDKKYNCDGECNGCPRKILFDDWGI